MSEEATKRTISRRHLLQTAVAGAAGVAATSVALQASSAAPASTSAFLRRSLQDEKVEILHWSHPLTDDDMKVFDPLIQRFQETNPNISVKIELVPWEGRVERKMSAAAAGTSPDTSYTNVDEFTTYAVEGALVELDDYMPESDRADFLPGPRDAMEWEGHIYEIPVLHAFRVSYFNEDVWTQSGLDPANTPTTWPDLDAAYASIKTAKDAGTHNAWPTSMEGSGSGPTPVLRNFNPWFYQAGGSLIAEDGKSGYDSESGIKAITWATHIFQTYCSESDRASKGDDLRDRFGQGLFAYDNNNELGNINILTADFPDLNFGIANTTGDVKQWTHGGVGCFAMWTPSKNRDQTWKWMDFLTRDGNLEYNQKFGYVPPRTSVRDVFSQSMSPIYAVALEQQQYAGVEKHPRLWDMWDVISPELEAAFAGSKTPEEAIHDAASRINSDILSS